MFVDGTDLVLFGAESAIAAVVCMVTDLYITYDIDRILITSYLTMPTG